MTLQLNFADTAWEQVQQNWSAWWAGELERALVVLECIEPQDDSTPHYASTFLGNFGLETPVDEILKWFIPRLQATHYLGDAFPRWWPNFGPGIVAARAGAHLHTVEETTWFSAPVRREITELQVIRAACEPWWQRVLAITQAAVERWGEQLSIGLSDLGGNLDVLAHLRGTQQLLLDLHDAPQEVERLVGETHRLWMQSYEELYALVSAGRGVTCWGPCWSPTQGYLLQSDFAYMISPPMFERFVMPDIAACCATLDYAFYHLDGKGQLPHLDLLLSLERLRGIQWVPGDGQPQAEHWLALLDHIRRRGKLCQVYVSAEGALSILRALGGKGMLLVINETLSPAEGEALLEKISQIERGD